MAQHVDDTPDALFAAAADEMLTSIFDGEHNDILCRCDDVNNNIDHNDNINDDDLNVFDLDHQDAVQRAAHNGESSPNKRRKVGGGGEHGAAFVVVNNHPPPPPPPPLPTATGYSPNTPMLMEQKKPSRKRAGRATHDYAAAAAAAAAALAADAAREQETFLATKVRSLVRPGNRNPRHSSAPVALQASASASPMPNATAKSEMFGEAAPDDVPPPTSSAATDAKDASSPGAENTPGGGKRKAASRTNTSRFRGVTHHCRTGRWEAHIWEQGRQVYLGGFDSEEQAALAYDIAAIKCRGQHAATNYAMSNYAQELEHIKEITKDDLVMSLRRQSKGYSRGSSKFRGVTRHQKGKWEARIGNLNGKKYRYLGLYDAEEDAAVAYDREAVKQRGLDAVLNYDVSNYIDILEQNHGKEVADVARDATRQRVEWQAAAAATVVIDAKTKGDCIDEEEPNPTT